MYYKLKLRLLNSALFQKASRAARRLTGRPRVANLQDKSYGEYLDTLISEFAPNRSFADIGCMWGISGHYCFLAEERGASRVTGVDVMYPTEAFTAKQNTRNSQVRFVQGDFHDPAVQTEIGAHNVVLCSGVAYHVPNPLETFLGLRKICDQTLILVSAAIPEMEVENGAVFYPYLDAGERRLWNLRTGPQLGITTPYDPAEGYGNWIWGLTPSAVTSMLKVAGFSVERRNVTPFGLVFVCRAEAVQFVPVGGSSEVMKHWSSVPAVAASS